MACDDERRNVQANSYGMTKVKEVKVYGGKVMMLQGQELDNY